jgi:hypothetical protein
MNTKIEHTSSTTEEPRFITLTLIHPDTDMEFFTLWDMKKNKLHYNSHRKPFLTQSLAIAIKSERNLNTRAKRGTIK